jgi:HD-GYP domain-containing protein (c-di-GMP phosphodiesterase class II)
MEEQRKYPPGEEASSCQEERAQLDAILRAFPDLVLRLDLEGRILSVRAGETAVLPIARDELPGKRIHDIFQEETGKKFVMAIQQAVTSNRIPSLNFQMTIREEECSYEARLVTLDQQQVVAILRDTRAHAQATGKVKRQLQQLNALHSIDAAITSSFDLQVTLAVILRQVIGQLNVDAADVLLLDPNSRHLEFAAGQGFQTAGLKHMPLLVGQGYAGIAALEKRTVKIPDLRGRRTDYLRSPDFLQEGFASYYAVPLIAKGQVRGVLEIYHRSLLNPSDDWFDFLGTLAGQAAIAIDSASLFQDLQRSNAELLSAYEIAIKGWADALELSGRESREHIDRVVDLSLALGRRLSVAQKDLLDIRRGAMLHDIGNLGVPEHLLNKQGPLSEEEWLIVREHPRHARQLLAPMIHLGQAMDIPNYHHERWDGGGYPDGLHGDQIPFLARLFAVVDVYDAMTHPRPYRQARSHEEAIDYIRAQAGIHFDPVIARAFLESSSEPARQAVSYQHT